MVQYYPPIFFSINKSIDTYRLAFTPLAGISD